MIPSATTLSTSPSIPNTKVTVVNCLKDNHAYLLTNLDTKTSFAVDPFNSKAVYETAKSNGWTISHILTTHSHWDHANGNKDLKALTGASIVASKHAQSVLKNVDLQVEHNSTYKINGLKIQTLYVPFHTNDHILYYFPEIPLVFTGDAIFLAGCGRFFSGTPKQALAAFEIFKALPEETQVYDGHEYTLKSIEFAKTVEPKNKDLSQFEIEMVRIRKAGQDTCPGTVGQQLLVNPFLRWDSPSVQLFTGETDPVKVVGQLRKLKDSF